MTIRDIAAMDYTDEMFRKFFVPRALFAAMSLIFGEIPPNNTILVLPLRETRGRSQPTALAGGSAPEKLAQLGQSLIGYFQRLQPFHVFLSTPNNLGLTGGNVIIKSVSELSPRGPGAADSPIVAYLITDQHGANLLEHRLNASTGTIAHTAHGFGPGNPYKVAERLLRYVQDTPALWQASDQAPIPAYDLPQFETSIDRNKMLDLVANTVVNFGAGGHWRVCCILAPTTTTAPLHLRGLQILGNSDKSPYNYKLQIPFNEKAISLNAYRSNCVIRRSGRDLLWSDEEQSPAAAVAIPIDGEGTEPTAVFYLTADDNGAFDADDMLLLRIIGRMIGEFLVETQAQEHLISTLKSIVRDPETMDEFFTNLSNFGTENDFVRDVELLSKQSRPTEARPNARSGADAVSMKASLVAIDINHITNVVGIFGTAALKDTILQVGTKLNGWIRAQGGNISAFRIWSDRFFLLMRDVDLSGALEKASTLQAALDGTYQLNLRVRPDLLQAEAVGVALSTRIGVADFDADLLRQPGIDNEQVRIALQTRLEELLQYAKDNGGNRIAVWDKKPKLVDPS